MKPSPYTYRRGPGIVCVMLGGKCQCDIPTPVYDALRAEVYAEGYEKARQDAIEVVGRKP